MTADQFFAEFILGDPDCDGTVLGYHVRSKVPCIGIDDGQGSVDTSQQVNAISGTVSV